MIPRRRRLQQSTRQEFLGSQSVIIDRIPHCRSLQDPTLRIDRIQSCRTLQKSTMQESTGSHAAGVSRILRCRSMQESTTQEAIAAHSVGNQSFMQGVYRILQCMNSQDSAMQKSIGVHNRGLLKSVRFHSVGFHNSVAHSVHNEESVLIPLRLSLKNSTTQCPLESTTSGKSVGVQSLDVCRSAQRRSLYKILKCRSPWESTMQES